MGVSTYETTATPEILVVGAGPSGLVAALTLLRNGIPVRIIEKSPKVRMGQRGAGITPRSLEAFKALGVVDRIVKEAISFPMLKVYGLRGGIEGGKIYEMSPVTMPTSSVPFPNILCLGQNNLERILREELERCGAVVEHGTELVTASQMEDSVHVKIMKNGVAERAEYSWMVGSDGARGIIRKLLGLSFLGETSNTDNICVGDVLVEGLDNQFWHMWGEASTNMLSLRPTESPPLFNFILSGKDVDREQLISEEGAIQQFLSEYISAPELNFGSVVWKSTYRPNIRMVNKMVVGRTILVGDSAHIHSFTGAQGMNTGVQDSFTLAWRLALVHRGLSPPSLLATYDEERLPVITEMLNHTTSLLNKNMRGQAKPSAWRRDGNLFQLGVNCRWSSIVVDQSRGDGKLRDTHTTNPVDCYGGGDDTLRAGDRAPDVAGLNLVHATQLIRKERGDSETRLFDIMDVSCHTVVLFSSDSDRLASVLEVVETYPKNAIRTAMLVRDGEPVVLSDKQPDFVLEDAEEYAHATYDLENGCDTVIIRPDGILGAIVKDGHGLREYFGRIYQG
ncbi:hypothetical protein PQX77_016127 [Marasmius sp. AFHP31]|nr:hypothetical protein PQX77_016127 [Marasmius sp. AFHP31]